MDSSRLHPGIEQVDNSGFPDIDSERFADVSLLGAGGMGVVYKAFDKELGRVVAIKVMRMHGSNLQTRLGRFQREGKVLTSLQHENVVRVFFIGSTPQGEPYIAMELLEGTPLDEFIEKRGRLNQRETLGIASQICAGVQAAHEAGIVHRDLKPSNVIVSQQGDHLSAKVVDFGIARFLNSDSDMNQRLTQTGEIIGSPEFMAPEQFISAKTDVRSDVYAIGCILYNCLAGSPPFSGSTAVEVAYKVTHSQAEALSDLAIDASEDVQRCVLRAMSKNAEERFDTPLALANALNSSPQKRAGSLRCTPKRRRQSLAAGIIAIIVPLACIGLTWWNQSHKAADLTPQEKVTNVEKELVDAQKKYSACVGTDDGIKDPVAAAQAVKELKKGLADFMNLDIGADAPVSRLMTKAAYVAMISLADYAAFNHEHGSDIASKEVEAIKFATKYGINGNAHYDVQVVQLDAVRKYIWDKNWQPAEVLHEQSKAFVQQREENDITRLTFLTQDVQLKTRFGANAMEDVKRDWREGERIVESGPTGGGNPTAAEMEFFTALFGYFNGRDCFDLGSVQAIHLIDFWSHPGPKQRTFDQRYEPVASVMADFAGRALVKGDVRHAKDIFISSARLDWNDTKWKPFAVLARFMKQTLPNDEQVQKICAEKLSAANLHNGN